MGRGHGAVFIAPNQFDHIAHDEHQRKGDQKLKLVGCVVNSAQQSPLDQTTDHGEHDRGGQQDEGKHGPTLAPLGRQADGHKSPQHEQHAVSEIEDALHAKDERQARRNQKQQHAIGYTGQGLARQHSGLEHPGEVLREKLHHGCKGEV